MDTQPRECYAVVGSGLPAEPCLEVRELCRLGLQVDTDPSPCLPRAVRQNRVAIEQREVVRALSMQDLVRYRDVGASDALE